MFLRARDSERVVDLAGARQIFMERSRRSEVA
jgi:hypothetical protein